MSKTNVSDGSELVRFDIDESSKYNFNLYQDAIAKYPGSFYQLKMRFDQYLKAKNEHRKDQKMADEHPEIGFEVMA